MKSRPESEFPNFNGTHICVCYAERGRERMRKSQMGKTERDGDDRKKRKRVRRVRG